MPRRTALAAGLAAALTLTCPGAAPARAADPPEWSDSMVTRLAALALIQSLNADLLSSPSATLTLDRWCSRHGLAPPGSKIIADRVRDVEKPADEDVRARLGAEPGERIAYRRVKLTCGDRVLSEADNWYRPSKLTEAMNRELETTDTAFGRVVRPLGYSRSTIDAVLLWQPLPEDWATAPPEARHDASAPLAIPPFLLRHRAVLKREDGTPFSLVVENYTSGILAFPPPVLP